MARVIVSPEQTIFLFNGVDTVEDLRDTFGDFEWMDSYDDSDVMTGQLIEWVDGSFRATSMMELRALRDALDAVDLSDY
jgi:hypothetical protein